MARRRSHVVTLLAVAAIAWGGTAQPADAHWADLAVAEITIAERRVDVTLAFPTGLVGFADTDGDGTLSAAEVAAHRQRLERDIGARLRVSDGVTSGVLTIQPESRDLSVRVGGVGPLARVKGFVALGIGHILTGYDHVLFLISLLVVASTLGDLVKVVSAFTIAHSITLSLAVLRLVTLPGRWVESAIALSITYVAAENFWRKDAAIRNRWLITFGFGLVHGLGFASILEEFTLRGADLAIALAGFNLGVEIGQIAIVAAALGLLHQLRRRPAQVWVRRAISAGAAAAGLVWFVQRALL